MDILPYILTEEHVQDMTDRHLSMLADCSTERIYEHIIAYLKNENADSQCKERIYAAYENLIEEKSYFSSEKTIDSANKVKDMEYTDLSWYMEDKELLDIKEAILHITENKNAVPYIPPISNDLVKILKEELSEYCKANPKLEGAKTFYDNLKKNSSLFRDSRSQRSKGTIVKKVVKNPDKYEIILKGIQFILDARKDGGNVGDWRYI